MDASEQKLAYDLYYLRNLSFALDFKIIFEHFEIRGKMIINQILVTGGAGYIGNYCFSSFESGKEVVVLDNFSNSSPKSMEQVASITGENL